MLLLSSKDIEKINKEVLFIKRKEEEIKEVRSNS
jgi:hypothetical protein